MRLRLFALLLLLAFSAWGQAYPARAVRVVVPFPPGGAPDLVGRTLAARLAERLGQPFVVENRTGAGGNIAAEAVAKSPADGYTLFAPSDGPLVINPNVYASVPFDTLRDFAPISLTASVGLVLMACGELPVSSVRELVALSNLIFGAISTGLPHIRAGKLKALAVTTPRRHPGLPDTPTFPEAGHPSVTMEAYFGLLAPAGTPRAIIERLHAEVAAILKEKETVERLRGAGLDVAGNSPEEFSARLKADLEKFGRVAKSLGTKAE